MSSLLARAPSAPTNAPTNAPMSEFLSPESAASVYVALLNAHMEAVRLGWKDPEKAPGQYRWLEERLIATATHASLSDWEREAYRAVERHHLTRIADLERQVMVLQDEVRRKEREIETYIERLRDRNPPK